MAHEEGGVIAGMDPSYPLDIKRYQLLEVIGSGVSSVVHKATCTKMDSSVVDVAIKVINLEKSKVRFVDARRQAKSATSLDHPNLLRAHCFFTVRDDNSLWVVMPLMSGGSLRSIIASSYPDGLPEACIAAVLKQVLNALCYLHGKNHLHRDIKAGNILVADDSNIKLADYGVSSSVYDSSLTSESESESTKSGSRYWMAPEVIFSPTVYEVSADIWMFGVTALELAHGRPPLSDHHHLPTSKISKSFKHMVGLCLDHDPSKRPVARMLLKHPFFANRGVPDLLFKNVMPEAAEIKIDRLKRDSCEEAAERVKKKNKGLVVRGWKLNEEWFELVPVQETDINDAGENSCSSDDCEELNRELQYELIRVLNEDYDIREKKLEQYRAMILGTVTAREELLQETANQLELEVENRKIVWFEMDMELEKLRVDDEYDDKLYTVTDFLGDLKTDPTE